MDGERPQRRAPGDVSVTTREQTFESYLAGLLAMEIRGSRKPGRGLATWPEPADIAL